MTAKLESYFSAKLDPELIEMLEKFNLETPELNIPDKSESNKTNNLVKEVSDNFMQQLNISLQEDDNKILNNQDDISSDKVTEVNSQSQPNTEKPTCVIKSELEKNESCCTEIVSLDSSKKIPKELIDPCLDEKIIEDFKNLIIIEENSDSEDEEDIDEIKERGGPDKHPRQNVRFHPISSSNWQIINDVNVSEPPHDYSSFTTNNNQFLQSNNIIDPSCMINNDPFLDINSRNLDSSSTSIRDHFSELHYANFDTPYTSKVQFSETKNTGHYSLYVTHGNPQFFQNDKLPATLNSFDQPQYLETVRINAFDDNEIIQGTNDLQVATDSRYIDCNTAELREDILPEDLTSKFLSVEEVEYVFKNLSKPDCKFCKEKNDLVYPQEQLLPGEKVESKLNDHPPELSHNSLFNTLSRNGNIDHQTRFNCVREHTYIPNFTSISNNEDNLRFVNKDKENISSNNTNDFFDKTNINVNSCSGISELTQNFKNLSSVGEKSVLSPSYESSDFDKTSLEIETKIKQLYAERYLKEKSVSLLKNMSKYKQSVSSNISKSVHCDQAQNSNNYCDGYEYPRLSCMLNTTAAANLLSSPIFCHDKQKVEEDTINREIQRGLYGTEGRKVIHLLKRSRKSKNKKTNLHEAVLSGNVEKAYSIVEIQKKHHGSVEGINIRDSLNNKTALDYANLKGMHLLADYLRENLGYESVIIEPHSPLSTIGV